MNLKMKRKILSTLLNVMYAHRHDTVVVRNSCLILCQFELPHDVKFEYEKLVKILLFIISEHTSEDGAFVQRASICLLNSLACQGTIHILRMHLYKGLCAEQRKFL